MKSRQLMRALLFAAAAFVLYAAAASSARIGSAGAGTPAADTQAGGAAASDSAANRALQRLRATTQGEVAAKASEVTGVYDFVRAASGGLLVADNPLAPPETRARAFLAEHGALVGLSDAERAAVSSPAASPAAGSALRLARTFTDKTGATHVRLDQTYKGLRVFGAQVVVHLNARGVTAVNGVFVPGVAVPTSPALTAQAASQAALAELRKRGVGAGPPSVTKTELAVYRTGLLEGFRGESRLAYSVRTSDALGPFEQVWVDAQTGAALNRIPLRHSALNRRVYTPKYDSSNPDLFVVRGESDLVPSPVPFIEGLFQFSGHAYRLFSSAFGRDSFDGQGSTMRAVSLVNSVCPNAYWDGQTTNYCPEIDSDDVVAHEWGHGYTQFTHDLVYSFQSGALNESYSDIFGETVDLLNGVDGEGGSDNTTPTEYTLVEGEWVPTGGGVRWRVGEDVAGLNQPAALGTLRDMWSPAIFGDPDKVSSAAYHCGPDDGGGVHTNSGVPNHAFAMLVDGKTFNGVTVQGIGLTKALHIYYRAMTAYQTPTTNFAQHEQALLASCQDLTGQPLNALSTSSAAGAPSGEVITASDCAQVALAAQAVEMSRRPEQCNFGPLLAPDPPAACSGSGDVFREDFETGLDGWALTSTGSFAGWPGYNFTIDSTLPASRAGSAAFAYGGSGGVCGDPNGDRSGRFSMDSPVITVPAGAASLKMSFDQFVATEFLVDGGNVLVSRNGGAFALVPQSAYLHNAPTGQLRDAPPADQNTNPKAGEMAWSGADPEVPAFGTTVIDLSSLVAPGDTFRVRFEFGLDGCGGNQGWYVDDVRVYSCPVLAPPVLSLGAGYEDPDRDGSFELRWTRPEGAAGPDLLQRSTTSCAPLFSEDAENGFGQWVVGATATANPPAWETSDAKPQHASTAFFARGAENSTGGSALMMTRQRVRLPAAGTTTLDFLSWNVNESDDATYVEVSEDGFNWSVVYTDARSALAPEAAEFFALEPLARRTADLTAHNGRQVYIRFRYTLGPENKAGSTPFGWYVDDIRLSNESWADVATVAGTSHTVSGLASGQHCFRVRTAYDFGAELAQSPFSNAVSALVDLCLFTNVAAASEGATATASSTYSSRDYAAAGAIDGDRTGAAWERGGGWNDATRDLYPDWLQVDFAGPRRVSAVNVFTLADGYASGQQPTAATSAALYGLVDFEVQYWDGSAWVTVPGGSVAGNDRALRAFTFPEVTTTKIRVLVHNAREHFSRVVEVEAFGCPT